LDIRSQGSNHQYVDWVLQSTSTTTTTTSTTTKSADGTHGATATQNDENK
jgi:hypothetical protein